jgi:hypothetical protein
MTNPMPRSAERTRASGIEGGMCDLGVWTSVPTRLRLLTATYIFKVINT